MVSTAVETLDEATVSHMQNFYQTLNEKDRRRFAALEARRLGKGGIVLIAEVLGCSTRTINRGILELEQLPHDPAKGRIRRQGAGRKKRSLPDPLSRKT